MRPRAPLSRKVRSPMSHSTPKGISSPTWHLPSDLPAGGFAYGPDFGMGWLRFGLRFHPPCQRERRGSGERTDVIWQRAATCIFCLPHFRPNSRRIIDRLEMRQPDAHCGIHARPELLAPLWRGFFSPCRRQTRVRSHGRPGSTPTNCARTAKSGTLDPVARRPLR